MVWVIRVTRVSARTLTALKTRSAFRQLQSTVSAKKDSYSGIPEKFVKILMSACLVNVTRTQSVPIQKVVLRALVVLAISETEKLVEMAIEHLGLSTLDEHLESYMQLLC